MKAEKDYGTLLRNVSESAKALSNVPEELLRNWTLQSHSGDALLRETDWNRVPIHAI